jgi:hypothetical protein
VGQGDPSPVRHNADQSYSYGLNYYSSFPSNNPQPGWYWCNACQGLWVVSTAATNFCPANGLNGHVIDDGSDTYGLTWNGGISPKVSG